MLYEKLGTQDRKTGFSYSFGIVGTVTVDGVEYYHGRWSWLVSDASGSAHLSLISEFFLSLDGTVFHTGAYDYTTGAATFYEDTIDF